MENFIVSARKYRPQAFEAVVGQQHVTNTLDNAIRQNHLAQALLFTGPRGVGKTTCARILARMINAQPDDTADTDYSFNIFELDAASNNSVDDIRNLIDQVRFAPQAGQYKVYIIDEVHMLSANAFNAFLKTLEEPPRHAIFILATTEKHKIIPTILSRCQIYDFRRITVDDIAKHLEVVANKEGLSAEPDALHLIAQKADGALRDALSIFDRMVAFSNGHLTYQSVAQNLNVLDYDYYFKTVELALGGDAAGLLLQLDQVLEKGFDAHIFLNGLAGHLRDLLVGQDARTIQLLEVGEQIKKRYLEQAAKTPAEFLLSGLQTLSKADVQYKSSNNPRLLVELALVQLIPGLDEKKNDKPVAAPAQVKPVVSAPPAPLTATAEGTNTPASPQQSAEKPIPAQDSSSVRHESNTEAPPAPAPKPEAPKPQPAPPPTGRISRTVSISATIAQAETLKEEEKVEEDNQDGPTDSFALPQLMEHWRTYTESIKEHRPVIYSTLTQSHVALQGTEVHIEVGSTVNAGYIQDELRLLQRYLREKLNNYQIRVDSKVTEREEKKSLYTPQEKYQHMVQQNPTLDLLRTTFDLDLE